MKSIYDMTMMDFENYFLSINEKKYRKEQLYFWIYQKKENNFDKMTNLNHNIITHLKNDFKTNKLKVIEKQTDINTYKYLFELEDQNKIETVLMKHNYGNSVCISTQIGCNMGCIFCESGKQKKVRNLEVYEMILQVLMVEEDIKERVSSVVLMGIGEPLDNYDNVIKFIKILNDNKGLNIGIRHITLSTCGIIPKINELSNENIDINLAISLHASNNETRNKIMPINKIYDLKILINTIKNYINKTNRRITFEYIMLSGVNDSKKDANELSDLVKGINCYINLIPYNKTSSNTLNKTKMNKILEFYDILKKNKINVTIRKEYGSNIDGACGQLKNKY